MKLVKTASGKMSIKISKQDWMNIGKKQGWVKEAQMQGEMREPIPNRGWGEPIEGENDPHKTNTYDLDNVSVSLNTYSGDLEFHSEETMKTVTITLSGQQKEKLYSLFGGSQERSHLDML